MKNKKHILFVEDDPNLGMVTQDFLELSGYQVHLATDGEMGLSLFKKHTFDICILDVMLPKLDGFSLAQEIKKINFDIPIIFLTAKALKNDRILGLKIGADDYITKPFSTEELSLRIAAILRRTQRNYNNSGRQESIFNIGKYTFDYANLSLKIDEHQQTLTRKEADLLKLLCEYPNQVITREFALKNVWGDDDYFIGRSMDVFLTRLRKYLKDDPNISIQNIHGTGFKLIVPH